MNRQSVATVIVSGNVIAVAMSATASTSAMNQVFVEEFTTEHQWR